jgi:hypothetical protein
MGRLLEMWRAVFGPDDAGNDGYGQSLIDDIRSARRFRALRRQAIEWHPPSDWRGNFASDFPILDRFGDGVLCWHSANGEDRIIIDRMWHGWPDPPEFAIFAFDEARAIAWATDFHHWPETWVRAASPATHPQ